MLLLLLLLVGAEVEAGDDESSVAFYFRSEPADTWVPLGGRLTLSCSTSTTVEKTWSWRLHQSTSDDSGTLLEGEGDSTLVMDRVGLSKDSKFITCAADVFGTQLISRYAIIRVSYLEEEFEAEPSDASVPAGTEHVRLECRGPRGNPPPYITWSKDGKEVDLANTYVDPVGGLNILNVRGTSAGSYRCVANSFQDHPAVSSRNAYLTVSGSLTQGLLPVTYDVTFAKSRYRITARKGDSIRVLCGFLGNPTPSFSVKVTPSSLVNSVSEHGTWATLHDISGISSVKCEGTNSLGSQTTNIPVDITGTLQVAGGIPVEKLEGEAITMVCSESQANGDPTFSWFRNGVKIAGETARYLEIVDPTRVDSGMYQCFAATDYAKEQSTFALTINGLQPVPVKVTVTSDEYGLMGESLQLSCVGQGNPVPSITWHRKADNTENAIAINDVTYKETFTEVLALLNLGNLTQDDHGIQYICKGENSDLYDNTITYRAESSIDLKVVEAIEPSISLPSTSVIKSGTPLTLICSVEGSPPPALEWFKDGEKIEGEAEEKYVTDGEAGVYSCRATNMLGTVEQKVIVQSKPEFSGGEIFLIVLIAGFLALMLVVGLLILIRRHELERRTREGRAKEELLLENEKRFSLTPSLPPPTPRSDITGAMTPTCTPDHALSLVQESLPGVSEAECQTPRSILSPRPATPQLSVSPRPATPQLPPTV